MNYKLSINCTIIFIVQIYFALSLSAQKLPNKQIASVWAPTAIKIDGRADEWNSAYQAYNKTTEIYYTIANDDQNLYLVAYINSPDPLLYKVMTGGITLIIKNKNNEISLRYPAFDSPLAIAHLSKDDVLTGKDDDPIITKDNKLFMDKAREIEVIGVSGIDDHISIYNENGIKAAGRFDAKRGYVYELAIPLKYLGLSINTAFDYQILLNGGKNKYVHDAPIITSITAPDGTKGSQTEIDAMNQRMQGIFGSRFATTDFSGTYTLARKP